MKSRSVQFDYLVDDESLNRQYLVRFTFAVDAFDPGDWTTPAAGGEWEIERLNVLQARTFDAHGDVAQTDVGTVAAAHNDRVWQLLDEHDSLRDEICDAACAAT